MLSLHSLLVSIGFIKTYKQRNFIDRYIGPPFGSRLIIHSKYFKAEPLNPQITPVLQRWGLIGPTIFLQPIPHRHHVFLEGTIRDKLFFKERRTDCKAPCTGIPDFGNTIIGVYTAG